MSKEKLINVQFTAKVMTTHSGIIKMTKKEYEKMEIDITVSRGFDLHRIYEENLGRLDWQDDDTEEIELEIT